MADLLRRVTTRSGYDPRDFVLFAYGGAGPTHACQYAAFAGIATVIAPTTASGQSAFGAVTADRHRSFSLAFGQHAPARFMKASAHVSSEKLNEGFKRLEQQCLDALGREARIKRHIGMRFRQQVHEVEVEVAPASIDAAGVDALVDRFERQYEASTARAPRCAARGSSSSCCVSRARLRWRNRDRRSCRPAAMDRNRSPRARSISTARASRKRRSIARKIWVRARSFPVLRSSSGRTRRSSLAWASAREVDPYGHVILHLNG